jgi:hypothetical protein
MATTFLEQRRAQQVCTSASGSCYTSSQYLGARSSAASAFMIMTSASRSAGRAASRHVRARCHPSSPCHVAAAGPDCEAHGGRAGGWVRKRTGWQAGRESGSCVLVTTKPPRGVCGWVNGRPPAIGIAREGAKEGGRGARPRRLADRVATARPSSAGARSWVADSVASPGGQLALAQRASAARSSRRGWEALNALAGAGLVLVGRPSRQPLFLLLAWHHRTAAAGVVCSFGWREREREL